MSRTVQFEKYRIVVEPLSPIHIDSGVTVEPYQYDLRQTGPINLLDLYDLDGLLSNLLPPQRQDFYALVERLDFIRLRAWLRQQYRETHRKYSLIVDGIAFNALRAHLDDPRRLGEIHLMPRVADAATAYLPGSSIKGAIRTALVDQSARKLGQRSHQILTSTHEDRGRRNSGANFEARVFGNVNDKGRPDLYRDPLRQLAISDLGGLAGTTYIDRIQIVKHGGGEAADPSGIVMYRELTRHALFGEIVQYTGDLRLHCELTDVGHQQLRPLSPSWDVAGICRACNEFYRPRLEDEVGHYFRRAGWLSRLTDPLLNLGTNECLIRVGHHSHFECVTVGEPYRQPPPRGYGKTRSLVAGKAPLGWAKLRIES